MDSSILNIRDFNIKSVTNDDNARRERTLIDFRNGYSISIIKGPTTDGGWADKYEIAITNPCGRYCPDLYEVEHRNDTLGWLDEDDVAYYIQKVGAL